MLPTCGAPTRLGRLVMWECPVAALTGIFPLMGMHQID